MTKQDYNYNLKRFKKCFYNIKKRGFKMKIGRVMSDCFFIERLGNNHLQVKNTATCERVAALPVNIVKNIDALNYVYRLMINDLHI